MTIVEQPSLSKVETIEQVAAEKKLDKVVVAVEVNKTTATVLEPQTVQPSTASTTLLQVSHHGLIHTPQLGGELLKMDSQFSSSHQLEILKLN